MMTPRQTLTLDVARRDACRSLVYLGEGDVNGTMLVVSVTEDGRPFDCDGYTPYLMIPIGTEALCRIEGTAAGNVVTITVDESALGNVSGRLPGAYVSLESEGVTTSTRRFDVIVSESGRDMPTPDRFATELEDILARLGTIEAAMQDEPTDGTQDDTQQEGDG